MLIALACLIPLTATTNRQAMAQETTMVLTISDVSCESVSGTLTWQNMPPATILRITLSHDSDHYSTVVGDGTQADSGVYDFTLPFPTDDLTGWRFRAEAEITSEIPSFWFEVPGEHSRPCPVTPTPEDVTPTPDQAEATPVEATPVGDPPVVSLPSTGTGQSSSMLSTFYLGVGMLMLVFATSLTMVRRNSGSKR